MFLALQRHLMELRPKCEPLAPSSPSSCGPPELIELLPWPHPLPSLFKAPVSSSLLPGGTFPCSLQTSFAQDTVAGDWDSPESSVTGWSCRQRVKASFPPFHGANSGGSVVSRAH